MRAQHHFVAANQQDAAIDVLDRTGAGSSSMVSWLEE
jgi:hypothetical protein